MTSVLSHPQRLSGNKLALGLGLLLTLGACSPKVGVLRAPGQRGDVGANTSTNSTTTEHTGSSTNAKDAAIAAEKAAAGSSIALVLPFQLNQITLESLSDKDVKRSALALDFYQGFQIGLDELAKEGARFSLNVMDSRDNDFQNSNLAKSDAVSNASLIVGPVYPKEIKAFGNNLTNKGVLQINPLAATMPSEFNLPNLVSITPPIKIHTRAIAGQAARDYNSGDVIFLFNTADSDAKQFLSGIEAEVKKVNPDATVITVSTVAEMNEQLSLTGTNLIITGTTDKYQIRSLLTNLDTKSTTEYYMFKVYGHPLWDRIDFTAYPNFSTYSPTISSESHYKNWTQSVRKFKEGYYSKYGVYPSDHSYKGYDAARYFGGLLAKYGAEYASHLTSEEYNGLFSSYKFNNNEAWGFVNNAVSVKIYKNTSFQLQ